MGKGNTDVSSATIEFAETPGSQRLASSRAYLQGRYEWAKHVAPGLVAEYEARVEARRVRFPRD